MRRTTKPETLSVVVMAVVSEGRTAELLRAGLKSVTGVEIESAGKDVDVSISGM